jgi:hypothetical protein
MRKLYCFYLFLLIFSDLSAATICTRHGEEVIIRAARLFKFGPRESSRG